MPIKSPIDSILSPDDVAIIVLDRIASTISRADRNFLTYINDAKRVLVDRLETCDICTAHYVLYCDRAPEHIDAWSVIFFHAHGLIAVDYDESERMYLCATEVLDLFLNPPASRNRRSKVSKINGESSG